VKLNRIKNLVFLRVISGKPIVVVALMLICVAVLSAGVQADEVTGVDEIVDPTVQDAPIEELFYELPADVVERDKRTDSLEPQIISETRGPDGTNVVLQLNAIQDAFLSSRNANTPYGLWTTLRFGYDQTSFDAMRTMVQWDLSSIPSNAIINNATASIYQTFVTPPGDTLAVQGQYITAPWNESSVTWNNANYLGGDITQVGDVNSALGWKSVNVTEIVRTWHSGSRPNYGTILTADERDDQTRFRTFYSRQQSGFSPFVTIDYTVTCDNVPPIATVTALPTFSASNFSVSWSGTDYAPDGCAPSGIAYYDVEYKRDQGNWTAFASTVTFTSQTFEGGSNGSHYEFRARAVDNAGNVQAWPQTQASTTVDSQAPNATVNPLPEYTLANNFILTWGGTDNLSGIANYELQYQIGDGSWVNANFNPTTQTSFHVTGLQSGVTYSFRARATDNVGNVQPWSSGAQASTTAIVEPLSLIQAFDPPILKPTDPITDSFVVNWQGWTAPGSTITKYDIYWQFDNGAWALMGTYSGSTSSDTFDYPNGDGRYGFESVATNSLGQMETRNYTAEGVMVVDIDDVYQVAAYLPILFSDSTP